MILQSKVRGPIALLAMMMLAVAPVWSQEEAGEDEGSTTRSVTFAYEGWHMQPAGLNYTPATVSDPNVSVSNQAYKTEFEPEPSQRYAFGYRLPNNMGKVNFYYQAVTFETSDQDYRPGEYVFGETLAYRVPTGYWAAPGVNDDAFADGFLASTATSLREWALTYERHAFRTQRVEGRWSIGWRNTRHRQNQDVNYYAIMSPLPPLLPPTADCFGTASSDQLPAVLNCSLSPIPDTAAVGSTYDGRGPTAAFDIDINLWRDKLILETGAGFSVQRGKMSADYVGTNSFYLCSICDPMLVNYPFDQINGLIYDEQGQIVDQVSNYVAQFTLSAGTATQSQAASSNILELNLGLRWAVNDWFDLYGGFRSSRYEDVGLELLPRDVYVSISGAVVVPDAKTTKTNVTYEGFYLGLQFSFF